jgi:hypothetical protein
MFDSKLRISHPLKFSDSSGDSEVAFDNGNARTIYGDPLVQVDQMSLVVHREEHVEIGDIIEVPHDTEE